MIRSKKNIAVSVHLFFLCLTGLFLIPAKTFAQCANNNSFLANLTPAGPGQTATSNCIVGGQYVTVNVVSGTVYNFSTCGSGYDTQITLYNAGTGVFVGYNDDDCGLQSTINWVATYTGILWVLIDQYFCSNGITCATLNITQAGPPPVNDACIGATPISCGATVSGSTVSATPDAVPAGCGSSASNSVWYSFVGAGQLVNISLCGSTFDTQLSVLTGACTSLSCVGFNDDDPNFICGLQSSLYFDALVGVTYYIRVAGFGTQSGLYTLAINSCDPQSGNDACSGAYAIACGQTLSGTIIGMNVDEIPDGCGLEYSPGVWFQFTGTDESVTLDLCGSNFDTQLSVFSGTCTSLICEGTNDDSPLCGVASEVIFHALNGVNYYVYVFGLPPDLGNFDLSMTCAPYVPEPQDCDGAVPLCSDQQFNGNSSGNGDVNDLDSSNQGCLLSGENQSSWYIIQPVTTGTIAFSISPTPIVDYDFAVWGPFPTVQCPITSPPLRCSFSAA